MSSAHRPTWAPAQGKEGRQNSKVYSSRDLSAHTKLKFRQPGQDSHGEVQRRDLKLELMAAERESEMRKKKGERGLVVDKGLLMLEEKERDSREQEEANKRRKLLQEVADLDKDDEDDDEGEEEGSGGEGETDIKGKGKATETAQESDEEEDSDEDDDEDETAELLRELEKIKRERAEEKERQERERAASEQTSREEEIALGNPLLNLQAALGASPSTMSTVSRSEAGSSSFGVKRRWDDDVIFKNQARGVSETPKKEFVNDLLRTEFHKKFLSKFVA
ncbi:spliceosome-associated CWC15 family protein [Sporobolomyces salmoneus]|uniref:spliceosome-associated CWC15 family protein n=1 Tax=Sporobolomyces salmoneus TaxID=183962 RepID=UPI003174F5E7